MERTKKLGVALLILFFCSLAQCSKRLFNFFKEHYFFSAVVGSVTTDITKYDNNAKATTKKKNIYYTFNYF